MFSFLVLFLPWGEGGVLLKAIIENIPKLLKKNRANFSHFLKKFCRIFSGKFPNSNKLRFSENLRERFQSYFSRVENVAQKSKEIFIALVHFNFYNVLSVISLYQLRCNRIKISLKPHRKWQYRYSLRPYFLWFLSYTKQF